MPNWPHTLQGIAFEWRRIRRQGLQRLPLIAARELAAAGLWLLLLPLTIALHLAGFRRITVFTDRIGHLALEPDCLLKEQALGLIPRRRWFMLAPPGRVANQHLLNYWKPLLSVREGRAACFLLASMTRWGLMRYDISHYTLDAHRSQAAYGLYSRWGDRPPLLSLTQEDEEWGAKALGRMGLPAGAWFVCVHVREAGFSPVDDELHTHRNARVENVIPAIREITRRGGWVIRLGDPSMTRLEALPRVIDYAHHPLKSERLDIILCAKSRFILGNTSGIALVGTVFGIPCAMANMIPIPTLWFNNRDISIPKLLWSERAGRYLSFGEIMASPVAEFRYASLYAEKRIRVDENSAEDIRDLVGEMLDRLEGRFIDRAEDSRLVERFRNLYQPHHCAVDSCARVGTLFLRAHAFLLDEVPGSGRR